MNLVSRRTALGAVTLLTIVGLYALSDASERPSASEFLAVVMVAGLAATIAFNFIQSDGSIGLSLTKPISIYGLAYCLYYLLPFLTYFFALQFPNENVLQVATLLVVGYLAFWLGTKGLKRPRSQIDMKWVSKAEAQALLAVCIVGILLTVYLYVTRVLEDNFFNQGQNTELESTVGESIRSVLGQGVQLPIILLLGLLSSVRHEAIARFSRKLLFIFGLGVALIFVLSSQTRPAVTAVLFLYIATRFYREKPATLRDVVVVAILSVAAVLVIQGSRIVNPTGFADAPNQFVFSVKNAIPNVLASLTEHKAELGERLLSRSGGTVVFLSEIASAIDERGAPFWGLGVMESLFGLIPRVLWPDKPSLTAPQIVAQELLGFPMLYDASLSPLSQFYFEGGWVGVILGYALLGAFLAWLTNRSLRSRSIALWIALVFVWGHVVNIEFELVLGVLTALRTALVAYILWRLLLVFLRRSKHVESPGYLKPPPLAR